MDKEKEEKISKTEKEAQETSKTRGSFSVQRQRNRACHWFYNRRFGRSCGNFSRRGHFEMSVRVSMAGRRHLLGSSIFLLPVSSCESMLLCKTHNVL